MLQAIQHHAILALRTHSSQRGADFRRRICELLGHPEGTSYDLEDLPKLWGALRKWLTRLRETGASVRRLELPDPGHMNRIGYSVRLAFPRRGDRETLARVLGGLASDDSSGPPTMPEAFGLVERSIRQFSSDFKALFWRAKNALALGGNSPDLRLVWSALREAVTAKPVVRASARTDPRFHLIAYEDDRGHLDPVVVTDRPIPTGSTGIACAELPNPVEVHSHYLGNGQGAPRAIARLLLLQALADDRLRQLAKSPLAHAVADGMLLFRSVDRSTWTLCFTRESEGQCRALVRRDRRRDRTASFRKLLSTVGVEVAADVFPDWDEVSGFDFADIADPVIAAPELVEVRALQRIDAGAQIHLAGGLRTAGGFLGTAALRPEVRCRDAISVSVYEAAIATSSTPPRLVDQLAPVPGRPGAFSWPSPRQSVDGVMALVASDGSGEIASRAIVFESAVVGEDYSVPSDPARWIAEGGSKDTVPLDEIDAFLAPTEMARMRYRCASDPIEGDAAIAPHHCGIDDDQRFEDLAEALACIGLRRRGLPEADLLAIGGAVGLLAHGGSRWEVLRAWVEAGYLDVLTNPRWRGRTYVPRRPRLVAVPTSADTSRVVLHGLPPRATRHRVRQAFEQFGAAKAPIASLSPCVPVPLAWRVDGEPVRLEELARAAGLTLSWVAPTESLIGDLNEVFAVGAAAPGTHTLLRSWDWAESGFRAVMRVTTAPEADSGRVAATADNSGIIVDYHARLDGPDEYRVGRKDGTTIAVTRSRTWALLRAFASAGRAPFAPHGARCFVRTRTDGAFVPLPAARALQLWSGTVSGPADIAGLGLRYAYAAEDPTARRRILGVLSGQRIDAVLGRTLAWLRAAASANRGVGVPIPSDVRQRLEAMDEAPGALALASLTIPPSLVPHLRRAVSTASTPPYRSA